MYAIILAGGKGERLRPLTNDRPKGMVEINGRPILAFQLSWLQRYGVTHVIISCGYLAEAIQTFFGDGQAFGLNVRYAIESEPLGRGGGFRYAMSMIEGNGPVVGTNGDIVTNLDLGAVVAKHVSSGAVATDVLVPLRSPYGIVDVGEGDFVVGFREKPVLPYWLNAGIYVFDPAIRELLPEQGDHEDTTFPMLAEERRLLGFRTHAFWRPADTIKDVTELSRDLAGRDFDAFLSEGS